MPDAIRYTFQYQEARYTQGVLADIGRLKEQGFELDKLKNSWSDDQYKGINSQWVEPDTGQRFEVQFHTRISFEAKQLTHGAYERLRSQQADSVRGAGTGGLPEESRRGGAGSARRRRAFPTIQREAQMPDKVTYYAIIDDLSSRERPAGVFRRIYTDDGGRRDEAFTRELSSGSVAGSLVSAERGDLENEFIEITEDEANQIVERIRARVTGITDD